MASENISSWAEVRKKSAHSSPTEDGSAILVHSLHCPDPAGTIDEIKTRYEARLKEIFR